MKLFIVFLLLSMASWAQIQTPAKKTPADFGRDLKLTDLPTKQQINRALQCADLAALMEPKLGNGDLSLVSDEVLFQLYSADGLCWVDTIDLKSPLTELNATHVDLQVEVVREIDRRRYNQLVAKFNELAGRYKDLMQISQMQAQLLHTSQPAAPVPPTIQVIVPREQKPVDLFPRSPLQQRSQQVDCTTYSTGLALTTTCTKQ